MKNTAIEKLLDTEEIKNLRIKYTHLLDSNRLDEVTLIFSEDAVCQTDREPWIGREAIKKGLEKAFADYDKQGKGTHPFLHVISNQLIEFTGIDSASGTCYLTDSVTQREPKENTLLLLGIYKDEYKKIKGKWFITNSILDVVWSSSK